MNQFANHKPGYEWLLTQVDHHGDDCLIWPFCCNTAGYGSFAVDRRLRMAHREMCRLIHGEPPSHVHQAAHSCGNRRCVNPQHITWKTRKENQLDRNRHGTQTVSGRSKLSRQQVEQIRQFRGKETSIRTAARYGVTESNVRLIQDGKTWKVHGRKHPMLLTPDQVITVRQADATKTNKQISEELGIGTGAVRRARKGETYRHVRF